MKALQKLKARIEGRRRQRRYDAWVRAHHLTDENEREMRSRIDSFSKRPTISIVLPVFNTDDRWLRECIESVKGQIYPHWQLCIADDRSTRDFIKPLLQELARDDDRIIVEFRDANGHISAASNTALALASGEFVALLDHDDELSPDALFWIVNELNDHPHAKLIYSDEDVIGESGRRRSPKFKPDLSPDLLRSVNYINHLTVYRRDVIEAAGGFRVGFEGSQDFDLLLRVIEKLQEDEVRHIPRVLFHWRAAKGSVAENSDAKSYAHENARRAIREHLERTGTNASVGATDFDLHRVRYSTSVSARPSDFSVDLKQDVTSLNQSILNSKDAIVCFVDGDLEPLNSDWFDDLLGFATQNDIGIVGGRVIDRDGRVIDGPMIVGTSQIVSVAFDGRSYRSPDALFRNCVIGNYSAVSLSCMAMRTDLFREVDGFDEKLRDSRLLSADICLRVSELGYRIVFNPFAAFRQPRTNRRIAPSKGESDHFRAKWGKYFDNDPFYNPNLSYDDGTSTIKL